MSLQTGEACYKLAEELYPINRSITGDGLRETLRILQREMPMLNIFEVASGTQAFDWTVPDEWNIKNAYLLGPDGEKVLDFKDHNLHVVGYSVPIDETLDLEELQTHLHSLPEQPDAIPYITSYYQKRWGFCLSQIQREALKPGTYRAVIDSTLEPGSLTYGEILLPGELEEEIFFSTYICHPSMANNELSGPVVLTELVKWLANARRRYSFRIVFIPETIGSLVYISRNLGEMKKKIVAGFNITCVGDDRAYSFMPSRRGDTLADKVGQHVLKHLQPDYKSYSFWLDRGSDERQYCSPGVDLPVASIMRTKYREYPEYHTSLDNLELISPAGLGGAFDVLQKCVEVLEANITPKLTVMGEPQLGKRGLYPTTSTKDTWKVVREMMNLLALSDGQHSLLEMADFLDRPLWALAPMMVEFLREGVVKENGRKSNQ